MRDIADLISQVEFEIRRGRNNAFLIPWGGDRKPEQAISIAVDSFRDAGWEWDGRDLTKGGWYAFFRSQGELSPPILQWQVDRREKSGGPDLMAGSERKA